MSFSSADQAMNTNPNMGGALRPPAAAPAAPDAGTQYVNALRAFAQAGPQAPPAMPQFSPSPLYQQALNGARSGINQSYVNAIGDIQSSQNAAHQALGTLPGQIDQIYGQSLGTINANDAAVQGAQNAAGMNKPVSAGIGTTGTAPSLSQYMQPVMAGIKGSQAFAQANVPLLATGIAQEGSRQTALANQDRMNANSQLDQTQMQDAQAQQLAQQSQQFQAQQAQNTEQNNKADMLTKYSYDSQLQAAHDKLAYANTPGGPNAQVLDPKTGAPLGYTNSQLATAQNSKQFQGHAAMIKNAIASGNTKTMAQVWSDAMRDPAVANNPALVAALKTGLGSSFPGGNPPPVTGTALDQGSGWLLNHLDMSGSGANSPLRR